MNKNGDHVQNEGQWGHCSEQCKATKLEDLSTGRQPNPVTVVGTGVRSCITLDRGRKQSFPMNDIV